MTEAIINTVISVLIWLVIIIYFLRFLRRRRKKEAGPAWFIVTSSLLITAGLQYLAIWLTGNAIVPIILFFALPFPVTHLLFMLLEK